MERWEERSKNFYENNIFNIPWNHWWQIRLELDYEMNEKKNYVWPSSTNDAVRINFKFKNFQWPFGEHGRLRSFRTPWFLFSIQWNGLHCLLPFAFHNNRWSLKCFITKSNLHKWNCAYLIDTFQRLWTLLLLSTTLSVSVPPNSMHRISFFFNLILKIRKKNYESNKKKYVENIS